MFLRLIIFAVLSACILSCSAPEKKPPTQSPSDYVPGYHDSVYRDISAMRSDSGQAKAIFKRIRPEMYSEYKRGTWMNHFYDFSSGFWEGWGDNFEEPDFTVTYEAVLLLAYMKDNDLPFGESYETPKYNNLCVILLYVEDKPETVDDYIPFFDWLAEKTVDMPVDTSNEDRWIKAYQDTVSENPNFFDHRIEIVMKQNWRR